MEVDRTHTEETSNELHMTSTYMEPPREEKKRKAGKHLAERQRERKKMEYTGRENGKNGQTNKKEWRTMVYAPSEQTGQSKYNIGLVLRSSAVNVCCSTNRNVLYS